MKHLRNFQLRKIKKKNKQKSICEIVVEKVEEFLEILYFAKVRLIKTYTFYWKFKYFIFKIIGQEKSMQHATYRKKVSKWFIKGPLGKCCFYYIPLQSIRQNARYTILKQPCQIYRKICILQMFRSQESQKPNIYRLFF